MFRPTYLPLGVSLLHTAFLITTYTMCVSDKHCPLIFPYMSATGRYRPESCFYSLGLSTAAWLISAIFVIRHNYVTIASKKHGIDTAGLNKATGILQIIMVVGMMIVSNFQDPKPTYIIHEIGSQVAFGAGVIAITLDCIISWKLYPEATSNAARIIRLIFCIWLILGIVANFVVMALPEPSRDIGGAAVEWSLWFGLMVTVSSYSFDFGKIMVGLDFHVVPGKEFKVLSDAKSHFLSPAK